MNPAGVPTLPFPDYYPRSAVNPTRPPGMNTEYWGPWEVWPHRVMVILEDGSERDVTVGLWVVWNAEVGGPRARLVVSTTDSLRDAEALCARKNTSRRTRVVGGGGFRESFMPFDEAMRAWTSRPMLVAEAVLLAMSSHDEVVQWML